MFLYILYIRVTYFICNINNINRIKISGVVVVVVVVIIFNINNKENNILYTNNITINLFSILSSYLNPKLVKNGYRDGNINKEI